MNRDLVYLFAGMGIISSAIIIFSFVVNLCFWTLERIYRSRKDGV